MPIKHDWEFLQCQNKKLQITRKMSKKKKKSTSRGNAMVEPKKKKKKTEPSRGKPQIRC